ncbi:hypothetical protein Pan216_35030 [Planctomycetes bacterium Pan216]|uniref:Uncharacterized protein n=1 Tax=Kolteria novifilia TaxID=2527975 RepID=A0A518B6P7_9BACT|nr:hypothetical protein Pan216_35030 [Planctomycetes bacterium Pan216]
MKKFRKRIKQPQRDRYVLIDGKPVKEVDEGRWDAWMDEHPESERTIAATQVEDMSVTTLFVGIDVIGKKGKPAKPFQSMVKGGKGNGCIRAYSSASAAEAGHQEMVRCCEKYFVEDSEDR